MIYYELKIESGDDVIEITEENTIYFAEVFLDTINNDTQKKSNAMLARVTIQGNVEPGINERLIKISEWARDLNDKTTYRKITLTVKEDATTTLRTYEIPDMFVCDYREVYGNPSDDKTSFFELNLTQKETKLKDFNTY
ncbi:MAG: hypothetical protein IKD73_00035 [Selenomonadaceae bacterium]|nr:hypothetical protein [Selenomonadaceae bacterium]